MLRSITSEQLETLIQFQADVQILDVRKKPAFDDDNVIAEGAHWRDPTQLEDWFGALDKAKPVICYCVYGHQVSQDASRALSARGFDAYYLRGGFDEWKHRSAPLMEKG
ncbi:MAG: sulfurtransferase [Rhodospirillaceae bacterium]|jgi:rhodanese-related sulfurtransferase|nr:sulfurtransferase [Rhodospirillaceae bacterium]